MKQVAYKIAFAASTPLWFLAIDSLAQAQISSDGTLPTNVTQSGNSFEITGGAQAGSNLFHSFREFSVPTGGEAVFNNVTNANNIANIISRVTGGSVSNIDGLIRENYGANFILINPSGINFGPNARLQIGGSFLSSTADSIKFADGTEFSATNPNSPLLTISVPVGLQMGNNPSAIRVQGTGHNLSYGVDRVPPVERGNPPATGLAVQDGQTLALVGGDIILEGGILQAGNLGRIELGSVGQGQVSINSIPGLPGWVLSYEGMPNFQNIQLNSASLLDASGFIGGSIQLQGARIDIVGGSAILSQNVGDVDAGAIALNATDSIAIAGISSDERGFASTVATETFGSGKAGNLSFASQNFSIQSGGWLYSSTYGVSNGGDITVSATESILVDGSSPLMNGNISNVPVPGISSSSVLGTQAIGTGKGGNIALTTERLTVDNGAILGTLAFGGSSGDLNINAVESILVRGFSPISRTSVGSYTDDAGSSGNVAIATQRLTVERGAQLLNATFGPGTGGNLTIDATESMVIDGGNDAFGTVVGTFAANEGNAGNVTVTTKQATITNGGGLLASTFGRGDSGTLTLNATESVTVDTFPGGSPSTVAASAAVLPEETRLFLGLPAAIPSGNSGDVFINTGQLTVANGSRITSSNDGTGLSGNININASSILLDNVGAIVTELGGTVGTDEPPFFTVFSPVTASGGKGGGIAIATDRLVVRNGSRVSTVAFTNAAGGDINIDAKESVQVIGSSPPNPFLFSFITASTVGTGNSGNVAVNTGQLNIHDGANVSAVTFGAGNAGGVTVNATQAIEVIGIEPNQGLPSFLGVSTLNSGQGGGVSVTAPRLFIRQGGTIDASTFSTGDAGNIELDISESIEVSGKAPGTEVLSQISSGANRQVPILIQLINLPDVPSGNAGNITIKTGRLTVADGGQISSSNDGTGLSGQIDINANSVLVDNRGSIASEIGSPNITTLESDRDRGIKITTQQLAIRNSGEISTTTFTNANGGEIWIDAAESVQIEGFSPNDVRTFSAIRASTFGSGNAGNVNLSTGRLVLANRGSINAGTFASGDSGDITVNATQSVEVSGIEPNQGGPSLIGVSTFSSGEGGSLIINAPRLVVRNGGRIDASTQATGPAGTIDINAPESVEVSGTSFARGTTIPSQISSGANIDPVLGQILELPATPSGASGTVRINTGRLVVRDRGQVSVQNDGTGNTGTLNVNARSVLLNDNGTISAATQSDRGSDGVNINLQVSDSLQLRGNSQISAQATGIGRGGNVRIATGTVLLLDGSNISASAIEGRGGNITIDTQGLFQCNDCQISATSQLGVDGEVEIVTPDTEANLEVLDVPEQVTESEDVVAVACSSTQGRERSEFIVTGRGGLPPRPNESLSSEALVSFGAETDTGGTSVKPNSSQLPPPARGWYINDRGAVVLAEKVPNATPHDSGFISPNCHDD